MKQEQQTQTIITGHLTDIGCVRSIQQDSLGYVNFPVNLNTTQLAIHKGYLYVVADGVGSSEFGELASGIAVTTIIETFYQDTSPSVTDSLKNAIKEANRRILAESKLHNDAEMQTTVVCAVVRDRELYLAHLGDSRAYLIRSGKIAVRTADHSVIQERLDKQDLTEAETKIDPARNLITQFLGSHFPVKPEISHSEVKVGDVLLLCSDGLHSKVDGEIIINYASLKLPSQVICGALVEQAKLNGGEDNISLIVNRIENIESMDVIQENEHFFSPEFGDIVAEYTHTALAPFSENATSANNRQLNQIRILVAVSIMMILAISIVQFAWFQYNNDALQTQLLQAQQNLSETHQRVENLRVDYEQGKYGSTNDELLKSLKRIEHQLQNVLDSSVNIEETPLIIPTPNKPDVTDTSGPP